MSQNECIEKIVPYVALASFLFVLISEGNGNSTDSGTAMRTPPYVLARRSLDDPIANGRIVPVSRQVYKALTPSAARTLC